MKSIWTLFILTASLSVGWVPVGHCSEAPSSTGADQAQAPSKDEGDLLYNKAPSEFFEMESVTSKVDLDDINHALLSAAIFHATNQEREKLERKPLAHLPRLDEAARMHADSMAEHEYVAHINPRKQERRTPADRAREVGLNIRFIAENVASHFGIQYKAGRTVYPREKKGETEYSYKPGGKPIEAHTYRSFAQSLVDQWMDSPGHRKNILSEQPKFLGAGCSISKGEEPGMEKFYCVQLFFDRLGL